MADPLYLVGYTSGVYTYTAWNTPVANPLAAKRNTPKYTLGRKKHIQKKKQQQLKD